MRRLMLLRHAKFDSIPAPPRDHEHPLSPAGRETAPRVANYLAKHALNPDLVVCSTAVRARETVDLGASAFERKPRIIYDSRVYNADPDRLLKVVHETPDAVHTLLLVGHNPGLQCFAGLLIATGEIEIRQQLLADLPPTGLAIIDFQVDDWRKVHAQGGRLDRFVTPQALSSATD